MIFHFRPIPGKTKKPTFLWLYRGRIREAFSGGSEALRAERC